MCKDVSALANSAGGQLIYGIEEKDQKPVRVDGGTTAVTREWIEQVLDSNVQPRMLGLIITPIELDVGFGFVISVPQTTSRCAHQSPDKKYYKRQNFQSSAMEDYEIRDIMRRTTTPDLFAVLTFDGGSTSAKARFQVQQELSESIVLHCTVKNRSSTPAFHVIVDLLVDDDLPIAFSVPPLQMRGTREQPPKAKIFRRVITSPPMLPVFQEGEVDQNTAQIAFQLPTKLLDSTIYLETSIQAAGFSYTQEWILNSRGGSLTLVAMKDRSKT